MKITLYKEVRTTNGATRWELLGFYVSFLASLELPEA